MQSHYQECNLCPRACGVNRSLQKGVCGASDVLKLGRAALHWWEEPCLVGCQGSGAIFFSHCPLGCVYCQNIQLAKGAGVEVSPERLAEIMLELQNESHAANINLVTATHYASDIARVLRTLRYAGEVQNASRTQATSKAHARGALTIPVVWNSSGYETPAMLQLLDGLVDIYLVDFKYSCPETAHRLSRAKEYPEVALRAIEAMLAQVGDPISDEEGMLGRGVIVRHLVLPGYVEESIEALRLLFAKFENRVLYSIMNQFTLVDPTFDHCNFGLEQAVSESDYNRVLDFADSLGIEDYFWQEGGASSESFIPAFDGTGVLELSPA